MKTDEAINFNELFVYDKNTGELRWSKNAPRKVANKLAGHNHASGYMNVKVAYKMYRVHRVIWKMTYGEFPLYDIDHINGNPSDNRLCNLRSVQHKTNVENVVKPRKNNKSGILGAHYVSDGRWTSSIRINKKLKHIGVFSSPLDAHNAYLRAKRQFHEGCTI